MNEKPMKVLKIRSGTTIKCHVCHTGPPCTFYNFQLSKDLKVKVCQNCRKSMMHQAMLLQKRQHKAINKVEIAKNIQQSETGITANELVPAQG